MSTIFSGGPFAADADLVRDAVAGGKAAPAPCTGAGTVIDAYLAARGVTSAVDVRPPWHLHESTMPMPTRSQARSGGKTEEPGSRMVSLVYDKRYRIVLASGNEDTVRIGARIVGLPDPGTRRELVLLRLARIARWATVRHPAACVVDDAAHAAWLVHDADVMDAASLGRAIGPFVTIFGAWRKALD